MRGCELSLAENSTVFVCGDAGRMAKDVDTALQRKLRLSGALDEFAGGTTMARNFLPRLKAVIAETELPIRISDVYLAKDPLNTTAKGALVGALLNM